MSLVSSSSIDPVAPEAVWPWLDELHAAALEGRDADLLNFQGVDVLDAMLSPIYVTALNAARAHAQPRPSPAERAIAAVRYFAHEWKTSLIERQAVVPSAPPEPTDVVLWSCDVTHTAVQYPVMQALAERGVSCRMLACRHKVALELRDEGTDALYTLAAWGPQVRAARQEGRRRARALERLAPWNLPDLGHRAGSELENEVRQTIAHVFPLVAEAVVNTANVLDRMQPKVLVVGNDLTIQGRVACLLAAARGVPTAMIMHGSIAGDAMQGRHCADRLLLFGDVHRELLRQQGLDERRLVVCGSPQLDRLPKQTGQTHPDLQAGLNLPARGPWILVATSGPGHRISQRHHEIVVANLARLSQAFPDVPVVVKLHRKDQLGYYTQAQKDCAGARFQVVPHGTPGYPSDIFSWLQGCTLVLTGASATAQEAMLLDVPVITMDFCDEVHNVDFIDAGATLHVRTEQELIAAVRGMLESGGLPAEVQRRVQAQLSESFHSLDGRAAQRCAAALCDLAGVGQ